MAFSFVKQSNASTTASGTSLSTTPVATAAGNHLFVHLRWETGDTAVSVSDAAGNAYTAIAASKTSSGAHSQWFYCLNANGSASNAVTATWSAAQSYLSVRLMEFSGVNPSIEQPVISTQAGTGSTSMSSSPFNTGAAGLILVGVSSYSSDTSATYSAGYVGLASTTNYAKEAYRITSGPLSNEVVTYTGTTTASARSMDILTFIEGSSGGAGVTLTPAGATLSLTGYAPAIVQPKTLTPAGASLALTGFAPTLTQATGLSPSGASLVLSGFAPAIIQPQTIAPSGASLALAGYAPQVVQAAPQIIAPGGASLAITGYAPSVSQVVPVSLSPAGALLSLTGYAPDVAQGAVSQGSAGGGAGGGGGSVREVRAFAALLDRKPSRSQKKARRKQLEVEALALLPDLPEAEKIAPLAARIVYEQEARVLAPLYANRPVQALEPVVVPFDAHEALRELIDKLLAEALEQQKVAEDEENDVELLLFGT